MVLERVYPLLCFLFLPTLPRVSALTSWEAFAFGAKGRFVAACCPAAFQDLEQFQTCPNRSKLSQLMGAQKLTLKCHSFPWTSICHASHVWETLGAALGSVKPNARQNIIVLA